MATQDSAIEQGTVTVITVTYGDRWAYLSRLLAFLAGQPAVKRVLVVDNHSLRPIEPLVAELGLDLPVTVLTEARNTGSAAAYGHALRHATGHPGTGFIYLLDDDNLPAPDAIPRLLERSASMGACDVLLSLRTDRKYLVDAAEQRRSLRYLPDTFCGNDILYALARKLRLAAARSSVTVPAGADIEVDYAPYGGMLFRSDLPAVVGYPNAAYFLYADDYEYVCRIRAAGGTVRLCPDSLVKDMEEVWFDAGEASVSPWFSPKSTDFRVFYSVRNQVALEQAWLVKRPLAYFTGGVLAVLRLAAQAWRAGVPARLVGHRLRLIWRATRQGWSGQLGEVQL